jgi:hypothetical protein
MDDTSLLRKLDRVVAPLDFDRRVLAQLAQRRTALPQARKARIFRYSLAGAAAALLVCFLVLNMVVLRNSPGRGPMAGRVNAATSNADRLVPIMESMNYRNEVRGVSYEPKTVFILEQVSDTSNKYIHY